MERELLHKPYLKLETVLKIQERNFWNVLNVILWLKTGGRAHDNIPEGWKNIRPCRYFQNGEGKCAPKNGKCDFDHSVIPFNEREVCFHKQKCQYKPFCIFYHPEGQREGDWQTNFKKTKICRYAENNEICTRSECHFFHPTLRNNQGFHGEPLRKPPIMKRTEMMTSTSKTPMRLPVIVLNHEKLNQDLSQGIKVMKLD